MKVYFEVRAISPSGEWLSFETDSLIYAVEKFKFYYYGGHEKVNLIMHGR